MDRETAHFEIVEKLFISFAELERAISGARTTLAQKETVPASVFSRLDSYDQIIANQRKLAFTLLSHLKSGNITEVGRHVTLINSLSQMIIEDARAILGSLGSNASSASSEEDINLC